MNISFQKKINRLPFLYILLSLTHPVIYFIIIIYLIGLTEFKPVIINLITIALPLLIFSTSLFLMMHFKLKKTINHHLSSEFKEITSKDEKFINNYSFWGTLFLIAGNVSGPVVMTLAGHTNGTFVSVVNVIYNIIIGELLALAVCMFFYFFSKIQLYPLVDFMQFKPIKLLYRFLILILSAIFIILSLVGSQIYKISQIRIYDSFYNDTVQILKKNKVFLDANLQGIIYELSAYSISDELIPLNIDSASRFYDKKAVLQKNSIIEMSMISNSRGYAYSNFGSEADISELDYFKKVMQTGKPDISEPQSNIMSHQNVIVCSVPILRNDKSVGLLSATVLTDKIRNELNESGLRYVEFTMISNEGKIYIHRDNKLIGKIIGKDIIEDEQNENINNILSSSDLNTFMLTFQGKKRTAMKITLDSMDASLILMMDTSYLSSQLDKTLLFVMTFIILISLVIYYILWRITNGISRPIHNTVMLFKKIAEGDLTVESKDYSSDEFGELLRNFNIFLIKIKEVMIHALNSSKQLSVSADELSSTSVSLAYGAQQQAASVEEATSSLEEVSASISSIAKSSKEQSKFADQTYSAMGGLRKKSDEVMKNSENAMETAQKTIKEAKSGNQMMLDTIERMDNIDKSTEEIADVIGLIREISDQVNLLSLNAAIEAARAGEHGKGFAIVAQEISKLADQTAESTNTISTFVETGRKEVDLGRNQVNATSAALKNILKFITSTEQIVNLITLSVRKQNEESDKVVDDTKKVKEMADNISDSTNEQNITNEEMVKNVDTINDQTQSVAAAADKIATSADDIAQQAALLRQQIEFFKV